MESIYRDEMVGSKFNSRRMVLLEFNQYLEKYLWPFFDPLKPMHPAHVMSICLMVNEKFREGVPAWDAITGVVTSEGEIEITARYGLLPLGLFLYSSFFHLHVMSPIKTMPLHRVHTYAQMLSASLTQPAAT